MSSLPEHCSPEQGALAEPLSVVLHALRRAQLQPGQTVFVLGTGSIGILACSVAKALGASRVAAADINRGRLEFTKAHGLTDDVYHVDISAKPPPSRVPVKGTLPTPAEESIRRSRDNATAALDVCGAPDGFDIVMECTGVESSAQMGIFVRHLNCKSPLMATKLFLSLHSVLELAESLCWSEWAHLQ